MTLFLLSWLVSVNSTFIGVSRLPASVFRYRKIQTKIVVQRVTTMDNVLSKTRIKMPRNALPRVRLVSRHQTYYRDARLPIGGINGSGKIVFLRSRGVAYYKEFKPMKPKKCTAINWRWRGF